MDRRWNRVDRATFGEHRGHLLHVERVALRRLADPRTRGCVERPLPRDLLEHRLRLRLREWIEDEPGACLRRQPPRALVEQVRPCETEDEDGRIVRPAGEVLEQIEQRGLGPVDVFDDDHDRLSARKLFEQPPHRPEHLTAGRRRRRRSHCGEDALRDELRILGPHERLAHSVVAPEDADDLYERPERDPVPVRKAAAAQDPRVVADACAQLRSEPRLADARGADDRHEPA